MATKPPTNVRQQEPISRFPVSASRPQEEMFGEIRSTGSRFDVSLLTVLNEHLPRFVILRDLLLKYRLTPFKTLSVSTLMAMNHQESVNEGFIDEGCTFLELADQLSVFYSSGDGRTYVQEMTERLVAARLRPGEEEAGNMSLASRTMAEYFVSSDREFRTLLEWNPHLLGMYLYVLVSQLTARYEPT